MGCVLPTCAQGLVEPSSRWLGEGENKWSSCWGSVLFWLILVSVLLVSTWIHSRRRHRHSGQRPSRSVAHFPSRGRARWVGTVLATVTTSPIFQVCVFLFPFFIFWGGRNKFYSLSKNMVFGFCLPLGMLVAKREPTPCYHDAYSVGTPNRAFWEKGWQIHCKTMISPFFGRFFLVSKMTIFFFVGWLFYGCFMLGGPGILGVALVLSLLVSCRLSLSILVVAYSWGHGIGFLCSVPGGS